MGVQVSEVDNAAEARAIAREAKFPPIGGRGISGQGMHTGYKSYGSRHASEYAPWANANIIVCVSIESLEGLENVEAIAAVEGIDMIAYGHSDLSARLGVYLQLEHPTLRTCREITGSAGARQTVFIVMAGEGPPSTTCSVGLNKVVGGRPAPAMTVSGARSELALISQQTLCVDAVSNSEIETIGSSLFGVGRNVLKRAVPG
jgi:2-keto-3-deoxy-L-rhamnonate aldolase RhmA